MKGKRLSYNDDRETIGKRYQESGRSFLADALRSKDKYYYIPIMWPKNDDEKAQSEAEMSFEARQERVKKSMAEIKQSLDERAKKAKEDALQKKKMQEDMTKALAENKRQMEVFSNKMKLMMEAQGSIKK